MSEEDQFYSKFLPLYDVLVSYENRKERETPFWMSFFEKYKINRAHDCSCGTGHHVILFNELGINCSGSDISLDMIKKAQENCRQREIETDLSQGDFRFIQKVIKEPVDLIVSIGHALTYLNKPEDFLNHFKGCYSTLTEEGVMVIQTRNYNYLLKKKSRFLPIFKENHGFIYVLDYLDGKIVYNVLYFNLDTQDFQTFKTTYYVLNYKDLIQYLEKGGFKIIEQYSNLQLEPFDIENSYSMILVLKKQK